jgi:hypothetical protein
MEPPLTFAQLAGAEDDKPAASNNSCRIQASDTTEAINAYDRMLKEVKSQSNSMIGL